jgi:hypothetical protein
MAMAWPSRIKDAGGVRDQFHHVIDIVPTILEAAGLPQPAMVNGVAQKPIEGVSMAYTWNKANANVPGRRKTQYFEMFGSRGIYNDEWIASAPPVVPPWALTLAPPPKDVMNDVHWQLYDLSKDWSQADDLATQMPDKLRDMQQIWTMEASKYQVFPLDDRIIPRFAGPKPNYTPDRTEFTYTGVLTDVPFPSTAGAPSVLNRSYSMTAEVDIPEGGAEGMLVGDGGRFNGYGFYVLKSKPVFTWNLLQQAEVKWRGEQAVTPGKHTLVFDWKYDGPGLGKGGTGTLSVDGTVVDSHPMPRSLPIGTGWTDVFHVGTDVGTPVDDTDYQSPFPFTGKLDKVTIKLGPEQLTPEDREVLGRTIRDFD